MRILWIVTRVHGDVKQFCHQVFAPDQEQATAIGSRQQADVDKYLVTQDVDVQFVRHVPDELHEQFPFVQQAQVVFPFATASFHPANFKCSR